MAPSKRGETTKTDKPSSNLSKIEKPEKKARTFGSGNAATIAEMVTAAFTFHDDKAIMLASIRAFIKKQYKIRMGKSRQEQIKEYIKEQILDGRIEILDHDSEKIVFNKRFKMVKQQKNGDN